MCKQRPPGVEEKRKFIIAVSNAIISYGERCDYVKLSVPTLPWAQSSSRMERRPPRYLNFQFSLSIAKRRADFIYRSDSWSGVWQRCKLVSLLASLKLVSLPSKVPDKIFPQRSNAKTKTKNSRAKKSLSLNRLISSIMCTSPAHPGPRTQEKLEEQNAEGQRGGERTGDQEGRLRGHLSPSDPHQAWPDTAAGAWSREEVGESTLPSPRRSLWKPTRSWAKTC